MGITERIGLTSKNKNKKRHHTTSLVEPNQVTEESLEIWIHLPEKIRYDPSLASFQMEHQRLHGAKVPHHSESDKTEINADEIELLENDEIIREPSIGLPTKQKSKCFLNEITGDKKTLRRKHLKIIFLILIWLIATFALSSTKEKVIEGRQIVVPYNESKDYIILDKPTGSRFKITLLGAFLEDDLQIGNTNSQSIYYLTATVRVLMNDSRLYVVQKPWNLAILSDFEHEKLHSKQRVFELLPSQQKDLLMKDSRVQMHFTTTHLKNDFAFKLKYDKSVVNIFTGSLAAILILILMYTLIIWEIVHRTFATMISSVLSIGILAYVDDRPTLGEIMTWINIDTLLLLFSMMIFVAVLTETGIFDYLAVAALQITAGKIWPLFYCLCIITCIVSAFLDNVTTVILLTPISIRLCEVIELNPVPLLMAIIVHSNIGGTLTPIGDPPNVVIYSNSYIARHGVTFSNFIYHMAPGVLLSVLQTCLHFRFVFRDVHSLRLKEPKEIQELRREIIVWKRAADSLSSYSKDIDIVRESLLRKVKILENKLKKMDVDALISTDTYKHTLEELKIKYPIKNKILLAQSVFVLVFVLLLFFIQPHLKSENLTLGWVTLLGIILLIIISEKDDMDLIMARIEWTTLLFFASMFVTMETLDRLGLIDYIGKETETIIFMVPKNIRLAMAILIIMLVSSLTSCLLENITVTTMMVKIVIPLAENPNLHLPVQPLVWAIAFGPCLGGNGTLYGSSSNVVCAGIAEQHGYKISFLHYLKIVFPIMLGSVIITTGYLLLAHCIFHWH